MAYDLLFGLSRDASSNGGYDALKNRAVRERISFHQRHNGRLRVMKCAERCSRLKILFNAYLMACLA